MSLLPAQDARPKLALRLREAIIAGRYAPGERLSEQAISDELGVSRNTLRESFQVLVEQRLITRIPHRGVSVAAPTMADVIDIYRARRVMEIAALASANPLHPALAEMRDAVTDARGAEANGEWAVVGTANMRFHSALVRLSDSPRVTAAFENVLAELRLAFLRLNDAERLHHPFIGRNDAIIAAIDASDVGRATEELERYLDDSQRLLLSTYTRLGLD
ncbi:GntR family transcriptional regulator [Gulosibacter faecalis]|jgi:DNA-binding GntR family transcriptional regulator|uniref:GntR family transcriptional regulator n=1 Tax=Gulosibacter faecalis TaxID=272240 RepID=A0ABW5UWX1_9MICO|nr:GntR family transcriptional regulator [Gulosibacter faecalis]